MAKRKPRKPYKGILAVPAPKYENEEQWTKEIWIPKLIALLDYYEIDHKSPNKWILLAASLACDHVPGFDLPGEKGRKVDPLVRGADLSLFVALSVAEAANESVNNSARQIAKPNSFWPYLKGKNPGTLRDRFYLLKDEQSKERKRLLETIDALPDSHNLKCLALLILKKSKIPI